MEQKLQATSLRISVGRGWNRCEPGELFLRLTLSQNLCMPTNIINKRVNARIR